MSDDFPTLGFPTMFTNPALCMFVLFCTCFFRKMEDGGNPPSSLYCAYLQLTADSLLHCSFFLDGELTAVVAAVAAYSVKYMPFSAVGADGQRGSNCYVVSATLGSSRLRLSSFRMCHFTFLFNYPLFPSKRPSGGLSCFRRSRRSSSRLLPPRCAC